MRNKISDLVIGGFFVIALLLGISAQGADTGTVSATVTVQNVSVSVTDGSIAYGTLAAGATTNTLGGIAPLDHQYAVNNGNVSETLNIKNSATTTPGGWNIVSGVPGADEFKHEFTTTSSFGGTALTANYQTVTTTLAANATSTIDFKFTAPSSVTDYTQQSFSVTVQAVAN